MNLIKKYLTRENVVILATFAMVIGLFTSRFFRSLPSASLITLIMFTLVRKDFFKELPKFFHYKNVFFIFSLFFFLHLPYFFNTHEINMQSYFTALEKRSPFLAVGLALYFAPKLPTKIYFYYLYIFLFCSVITAFGAVINYLINYDAITHLLATGKPLPVIINHVRYSLFITFAIFIGGYLYKKEFSITGKKWEKYLQLAGSIFLILFLHIAGVRSGLLSFYLVTGLSIIYYSFTQKKYILGASLLSFCLMFPILTFFILPSAKQKVQTTISDLQSFKKGYNANFHSLHNRVISYDVGLKVWADDIWFGAGIGNLKREVNKKYVHHYDFMRFEKRLMPHNQYIRYGAAFGIIGFLIFLFSFYFPLFYNQNYKHVLLLIHYVIVSISFLFEGTLETQLGAAYVLTFILFPIYFFNRAKTCPPTEKSKVIKW